MTATDLSSFAAAFDALPRCEKAGHHRTADVDRFNCRLIRAGADVSFLRPHLETHPEWHRSYFQVSLGLLPDIDEKLAFIERNADLLHDWWHVDQLSQFVSKELTYQKALEKARLYVGSENPYLRRWGYVIFMPGPVKHPAACEGILPLLRDDDVYHVRMAEAWLLSDLAVYEPEKVLAYLKTRPLRYDTAGRAIQKVCDSYRIPDETKRRYREARALYR